VAWEERSLKGLGTLDPRRQAVRARAGETREQDKESRTSMEEQERGSILPKRDDP